MKQLLRSLLFSFFTLTLMSLSGYSQTATIKTDLLDYPPGSTAIITGSGWQPGETVTLQIVHHDEDAFGTDGQYHQPFTAIADESGNVSSSWWVPDDGDALGATLLLTATGGSSGLNATWTFTDGNTKLNVLEASGSAGGQITLLATLTQSGSGPQSNGSAIPGRTITFTLNGETLSPGTATTDENGIATLQTTIPTDITSGTYNKGIVATFAGDVSYSGLSGNAKLSVTGISCINPTISSSNEPASQTTTYGNSTNPIFSVTASGNVSGYQWQELTTASGASWSNIASANSSSYTVNSPRVAMNGYQYRVVVSGCSSSVTSNQATLTVNKKAASVTPANGTKEYGSADPALTGSTSGFLAADDVVAAYSRATGETVTGGPYNIGATLSPSDVLSNYDITYNTADFTITTKKASVTPANGTKEYGSADPALTGSTSGFLAADDVVATYSRADGETVTGGPYNISATLSPSDVLSNYDITYNTADFTITTKKASVTPANGTKEYGSADPALTGSTSGFLAADDVVATYSRADGETVTGGPYNISATLSPSDVLSNYDITYNTADFTITTKKASVTPANRTKEYGSADPALTGSTTGFLSGDNVVATYSRAAGETVTGGPYNISATLSPSDVLSNYDITYNTADFTITAKKASVTPANGTKEYGSADPALTGSTSGFLAADDVVAAYSRAAGETVTGGPYNISATLSPSDVLSNYDITYNTADFTITTKKASVTPDTYSKYCGQIDPNSTGTLAGFLAGDNVTATYSRTVGETGGVYTISATLNPANVLNNYDITYNTADFTINVLTQIDASASSNPVALGTSAVLSASVSPKIAGITINFIVSDANGNTSGYAAVTDIQGVAKTDAISGLSLNLYKVIAQEGSAACVSSTPAYMPVYDPNGNFITGGGWINSPEGALKSNSSATGKANFGFNAKYKKGLNQVDGNTEFQFQQGDFNFKSSSLDAGTLVISGAKATYRGIGTVNGSGNYGFMVSAVDGQITGGGGFDLFRIKIWEIGNGNNVVYDNEMGKDENGVVTTTLGGGSIVIHSSNGKGKRTTNTGNPVDTIAKTNVSIAPVDKPEVDKLTVKVFPNPASYYFTFDMKSASKEKVEIIISDVTGRVIEQRTDVSANTSIQLGSRYRPGVYIATVIQGNEKVTLRIIKGRE